MSFRTTEREPPQKQEAMAQFRSNHVRAPSWLTSNGDPVNSQSRRPGTSAVSPDVQSQMAIAEAMRAKHIESISKGFQNTWHARNAKSRRNLSGRGAVSHDIMY